MDPGGQHPESVLFAYLKSHPFVPLSLAFSALALVFASLSFTRGLSEAPVEATQGVSDEVLLTIAVDVEGEVARPGLIELTPSADHDVRVGDVLEAAGGLLPSADLEYVQRNLNLAALVTDGMKLYVPKKGSATVGAATSPVSDKVNINTASLSALTRLKGIGDARAQAIIDNRPYSTLEDLKTRAKLSTALIEGIKDEISF